MSALRFFNANVLLIVVVVVRVVVGFLLFYLVVATTIVFLLGIVHALSLSLLCCTFHHGSSCP